MDARTEELREAHDAIAEIYATRLKDALEEMPVERAVLALFRELVAGGGVGTEVADVGCGTGRVCPYLAAGGLAPRGVDLSPEMVRVARRDVPGVPFEIADVRDLPFADASLAGVVCWYSLMYLPPADRPRAYVELARVVRRGGHLATAFKVGDDSLRRGGRTLDVEFDIWWQSPAEVERRVTDAGFRTVFHAGQPAGQDDLQPLGYLVAQRV